MISTMAVLLTNPLIPVWAMLLCLVAFAILAWLTYSACQLSRLQKLALLTLRIAAFLILCWLMMQPVWRTQDKKAEKPSLVVMLDDSVSMEDKLPGIRQNRAQTAKAILRSAEMAKLEAKCRVLTYRVSEGIARIDTNEKAALQFNGGQSRLLSGIQQSRMETKSERPFACILLTDGLDTSGLGLEGMALDIPLIIPDLENAAEIKEDTSSDFSVTLPDSNGPRRVVKGWKTSIRISVNRLRGKGPATVPVALYQDSREIEVREVTFAADARYAQTSFDLTSDQVGNFAYRIEIRPADDQDDTNNRGEFALEVTDEQNRVLYLEGMARPDFKFMKRALLKERDFQTSVYVRMGNGVFINFDDTDDPRNDLAKLLTDDNLKKYKVLILGELQADSLTPAQIAAVKKFVERGGGLLFAGAAKAYGPSGYLGKSCLGPLCPVTSAPDARMVEGKGFPITFTSAGRNDTAFMKLASDAAFSPITSLWKTAKPTEGAAVFIETGDGQPVLATRRYGAGRTCIYLSNTLYTLRLHGGASDGISIYDRLISQTVFWMLPDAKKSSENDAVQLLLKSDSADLNQKIPIGALSGGTVKAADLHCEVTSPDGKTTTLPMQATTLAAQVGLSNSRNGFLSEIKATQVGTYALEIIRQDGRRSGRKLLVVRRPAIEMSGAPVNRNLLKALASASKGKFLPYGEFANVLSGIRIPERSKETIHEESQWDSWWWLLPLMGLFCLEWYARRRWEMV